MRLSTVPLLGLAVGQALAVCPYASSSSQKRSCPYAERSTSDVALGATSPRAPAAEGKLGVMFMNRIAPSSSVLYLADTNGSNERQLLSDSDAAFEYHASFSPDGEWITFTSERAGDGQSDIYRVRMDGSGLEELVATPSFEDAGVISPDGSLLAYVSTQGNYTTNIWLKNIKTGEAFNLTNTASTASDTTSPSGHFRPSWSPDGEWIAFSSDRNTDWTGHSNGTGWEHTQTLSIYLIRPDGSDFKQLVAKENYSLGSPKWSPDGSRILFYEITREDTYNAHTQSSGSTTSQIASVDVATGTDYIYHTSGSGCKIAGQWVTADVVGFDAKGGTSEGLNYTSTDANYSAVLGAMRNPSWSPDGSTVVYEKQLQAPNRPMEKPLYSWDGDWEYRFTDVFPTLSNQGILAITQKQLGNSSVVSMNPDGTDLKLVFSTDNIDPSQTAKGLAGAFQPTWSPDGEWIAVGAGSWFFNRATAGGWIYRATANGSYSEQLTFGTAGEVNSGFPSFSPVGDQLVYRDFGPDGGLGLRILNITDKTTTNLTDGWDNNPGWSPDGKRIVFTRRNHINWEDLGATDSFDIYTIAPDGTGLTQLTTSGANDAHAAWSADGRIVYTSGMYGFRDECVNYDSTFQPYGQIVVMNADGTNKTMLTDSMWEDSMPVYVYNKDL
ncbi:hypothetical protein V495_04387 [Pseudogymnoascus sp. VKM F-4514 (FW-929)]|nr:hypothetical protein V495_04387 [Pseudogymnoascus sp. VKM F-4514 (FW-929)]KFY59861.1 hypothetical protein V497_04044 [Pseudogymnoascus sp. VKM F-4516 (FW-969)]